MAKTAEQIHRNMSAVRSKGTRPEIVVRHYLWTHGFRYRLNVPRLPGHPDIVLKKYRTCIFVNGCFWHGHEGCKHYTIPKTHTAFWQQKIIANKERDHAEQIKLANMGWHCITVWECQLKSKEKERTLQSLAYTLNHIYLQDHTIKYKKLEEENEPEQAAEQNIGV